MINIINIISYTSSIRTCRPHPTPLMVMAEGADQELSLRREMTMPVPKRPLTMKPALSTVRNATPLAMSSIPLGMRSSPYKVMYTYV